jgi:hypothetical protein
MHSLLIREYFVMPLIFLGNSSCFHTLLLSLFSSFDGPILGEVCFADFGLLFLVFLPHNAYFLKFHLLPNKSSFFPVNFWIEFS